LSRKVSQPMRITDWENLLKEFPKKTILVLGDFFLDRYLEIDAALDEPSLETGLTAYQVVGTRLSPGAAGTVANNLKALGVGHVIALGVGGEDGHGLELQKVMAQRQINASQMLWSSRRVTPTYTKPMYMERGTERELNRLDFQNHTKLPQDLEDELVRRLWRLAETVDGVHIMDQVQREGLGTVTPRVREELVEISNKYPDLPILADSRANIHSFQAISIKINIHEAVEAAGIEAKMLDYDTAVAAGSILTKRLGHPVYVTMAEKGLLVVEESRVTHISGVPVSEPIDPVGAGDSVSAAIISALAAKASPVEAATLGNVTASIVIQQLGTTGTASPSEVLQQLAKWDHSS
jgi:rfaE bifunctional protein kinase chain/domain